MPETIASEAHEASSPDGAASRDDDRAAIARSIDELLPALIAKLGATGLAELEVRQDGLRVRLRRPTDANSRDRRSSDRTERPDRGDRPARGAAAAASATHPVGLSAVGPGREGREGRDGRDGRDAASRDDNRSVATSPAVGIFQPRASARAGTRVRSGDRIGTVDMLGVPQDVVAPSDGVVGANLVEPGDAVEYGQGLVVIEFASASAPAAGGSAEVVPASAAADR